MIKRFLLCSVLIFVFTITKVNAQKKYFLKVTYKGELPSKKIDLKTRFSNNDSLEIAETLKDHMYKWREKGFITASVDTVFSRNDTVYTNLNIGKQFKWVKLGNGNIENYLIKQVNFKEKIYNGKTFSIRQFGYLQKKLIDAAENKGYPFAALKLDSILIDGSSVEAVLNLESGPNIKFDTISIIGTGRIKPKFITNYFKIKKGTTFDRSKITETERFFTQFPSIKVVQKTDILYSNYKAYTYFFLNHNPANSIDGIIGFLPNEQQRGKLLLTGQLNLSLFNIGGVGKDILIEWNKLKPLSQLLHLQFTNYNTFNTGLDLETKFNLLKEDTTFTNLGFRFIVSKYLNNNLGRVKFLSDYKNSRTTSTNATSQEARNADLADFNIVSYGLGYQWQQLDDLTNTRNGLKFNMEIFTGNKTVIKKYGQDTLRTEDGKSLQTTFISGLQIHRKISSKSGIYTSMSAGFLLNRILFTSDFFRLGGLRTLRGFNENHFFAKSYITSTLEYRYFYEKESYLVAFYDQGYMDSPTAKNRKIDFPLGIGCGLSIKTTVGVIQVLYSLGKSNDQSFNFNYSKVHFGIVNRF